MDICADHLAVQSAAARGELKVCIRPICTEEDRMLFEMALRMIRGWVDEIIERERMTA